MRAASSDRDIIDRLDSPARLLPLLCGMFAAPLLHASIMYVGDIEIPGQTNLDAAFGLVSLPSDGKLYLVTDTVMYAANPSTDSTFYIQLAAYPAGTKFLGASGGNASAVAGCVQDVTTAHCGGPANGILMSSTADRFYQYTPSTGSFIPLTTPYMGVGTMAQDANLNFYFAGSGQQNIYVIPAGSTTAQVFHQASVAAYPFTDALGVGSDGDIYYWDYEHPTMDVYDPSGNFVRSFGLPAGYAPETIAFDNQGHFFLANLDGSGFSAFDLNGVLLGSDTAPPLPPVSNFGKPALTTDNAGHLFEFDASSTTVNEFSYNFDSPEPSTVGLLVLGLLTGAFYRRMARVGR